MRKTIVEFSGRVLYDELIQLRVSIGFYDITDLLSSIDKAGDIFINLGEDMNALNMNINSDFQNIDIHIYENDFNQSEKKIVETNNIIII